MKTLITISILLFSMSLYGQTNVRVSSETIGFWTMTSDTMLIKKADNIVRGSVYCPTFSTDSVKITGCTFTVNGIATNGILIPPGEASVEFGFDYALMDSIRIMAKGTAWIMLFKKRN